MLFQENSVDDSLYVKKKTTTTSLLLLVDIHGDLAFSNWDDEPPRTWRTIRFNLKSFNQCVQPTSQPASQPASIESKRPTVTMGLPNISLHHPFDARACVNATSVRAQ